MNSPVILVLPKQIDKRVAEFLVTSDDPSILLDMRVLNGKPGSTKFDTFWDEVDN